MRLNSCEFSYYEGATRTSVSTGITDVGGIARLNSGEFSYDALVESAQSTASIPRAGEFVRCSPHLAAQGGDS